MKRIYILSMFTFFSQLVIAGDLEVINGAAKLNHCIPAGQVEKKYAYLKRLKSWFVKSEINNSYAIMFWCQVKNKSSFSKDFITVIASENSHPWSQCPSTIKNMGGSPTNLSLDGINVSGEFDSGGYYFTCKGKKWLVKTSH